MARRIGSRAIAGCGTIGAASDEKSRLEPVRFKDRASLDMAAPYSCSIQLERWPGVAVAPDRELPGIAGGKVEDVRGG